jgi:hypothetical protein
MAYPSYSNKKNGFAETLLLPLKFLILVSTLLGVGLLFVAIRCTDWLEKRRQPNRM